MLFDKWYWRNPRYGEFIAGAIVAGAIIAGAFIVGAIIAGAFIVGAIIAGAIVVGVNFAGAIVAGVNFVGAFVAEQLSRSNCRLQRSNCRRSNYRRSICRITVVRHHVTRIESENILIAQEARKTLGKLNFKLSIISFFGGRGKVIGKSYIDLKHRIWRIQICQKEKYYFSDIIWLSWWRTTYIKDKYKQEEHKLIFYMTQF